MEWISSLDEFTDMFDDFLEKIEMKKIKDEERSIIFIGHMVAFDKGTCNYMKQLRKRINDIHFFVFNESIGVNDIQIKEKIPFDFLTVPRTSASGQFDPDVNFSVPDFVKELISSKKYLTSAVDTLYRWHDNMGKGYAEWFVYYVYQYYIKLISCLHPIAVVYWNKFNVLHDIFEYICEESNIDNIFWEHGSLPGTFAIERFGQMGESEPAVAADMFRQLEVSEEEIKESHRIVEEMKIQRVNRNEQPKSNLNSLFVGKIYKTVPIILYTGQNDFESGIIPYTDHSKQYHSPVFTSSDEAAIYLGKLAKKNGWNLIYKPHPLMVKYNKCIVDEEKHNLILVNNVDINDLIDYADLTITILSQCAYAALIREKPVLMLGYIQLKGKGCIYEAYEEEKIEDTIFSALKNGYTDKQRAMFDMHVAQMRHYYLFDNLLSKAMPCGRDIETAAGLIAQNYKQYDGGKKKNLFLASCKEDVFWAYSLSADTLREESIDIIVQDSFGALPTDMVVCFRKLLNDVDIKSLDLTEYSELYISEVKYLQDAELMQILNLCDIGIHLIDRTDLMLYIDERIWKFFDARASKQIKEILTVGKRYLSMCNPVYNIRDLSVVNSRDAWEKLVVQENPIPEKYLYIEGSFFTDHILANELDIIRELIEKIGEEKFAVICYSEESFHYFQRKGIKAYPQNENGLECNLLEQQESKVIFSAFSSKYLYWTMLEESTNIYVDLHNWIIGKMDIRRKKGFRQYFNLCRNISEGKKIFVPATQEELDELLIRVTGGKVWKKV